MNYGEHAKKELEEVLCKKCFKKHPCWSDEVYSSWLLYIKGADRKEIIENTHFSALASLYPYFRKHECFKDIAKTRKKYFKHAKAVDDVQIAKYPWLLGLFYADGAINNGTKLSFYLSLHEMPIVHEVVKNLKTILGNKAHIAIDKVGNMYAVRFHGTELCRQFPSKNDKKLFLELWNNFNIKEKMSFISGFVDGDGSCSFEDGINSIHIYNKYQEFILESFFNLLKNRGYVSLKNGTLYISPNVGEMIKPFTIKRKIKKPYLGDIDVDIAFRMLKNGTSVRSISKNMGYDKKAILLALRRVYGKRSIDTHLSKNLMERRKKYSGRYDLDFIYNSLKEGKTLNSLVNYRSHSHVKSCLFKVYGRKRIKPYIRKTNRGRV